MSSSRSFIRLLFTFAGCQGGAVIKNPGDTVERLRRQIRDWEEIFAKTFLRANFPRTLTCFELDDYTAALGYKVNIWWSTFQYTNSEWWNLKLKTQASLRHFQSYRRRIQSLTCNCDIGCVVCRWPSWGRGGASPCPVCWEILCHWVQNLSKSFFCAHGLLSLLIWWFALVDFWILI